MIHFLQRHSMAHWNGSWSPAGTAQTFFYRGITVQRLETIIANGMRANASAINTQRLRYLDGLRNNWYQFNYQYNGITYRIGVNLQTRRVNQIYPTTTYY